ncbi:MAG: hypothetical protein JWN79_1359, partial [Gemmatimonadetes bacterium]|nr:hypothetical protein [Gemmatimonadota bacterium]
GSPPTDRASLLRAVADRAAGTGLPVIVVTDGELDDGELLASLPRGSRAVVIACASAPDVAIATLEAPGALLAGDTATVRVTLAAGPTGGPPGRVELHLDDHVLGGADVSALPPYAEQSVDLRGVVAGAERSAVLRAVFRAAADREYRNDTLAVGVDVTRAPAAVFVSTSPDYDAREAIAALRGVTSLPTRAYYRVAPGAWRSEGALARVTEAEVRGAVAGAPFVVLHGDTAVFGPPRAATRGSLLLFAPPAGDEGEWFASAFPASPLAGALGSMPLDSLPPLNVAPPAVMPRGQWQGMLAHRAGGQDDRRAVIVGWDSPRRIAVLGASGLWRWRFRGGVRADAYGALFGALYDWLAAGRSDRRAVLPEHGAVRAGLPVRWRRGAPADSVVTLVLRRRDATARVQTVTLRFAEGASVAESPALAPGLYDATMPGGSALLAVNASRELVPRRPTVQAGQVGGAPVVGEATPLRELGWVYGLAILALCAEWLLRRRVGLR